MWHNSAFRCFFVCYVLSPRQCKAWIISQYIEGESVSVVIGSACPGMVVRAPGYIIHGREMLDIHEHVQSILTDRQIDVSRPLALLGLPYVNELPHE